MSAFECDHHNYQGSADQDNSTTPVYDAYDQAGSVAGLVQTLNAGLAHAIQSYLTTGDGEFDESGPLWWRPDTGAYSRCRESCRWWVTRRLR